MTAARRDVATVEECVEGLRRLSDDDLRKLGQVARIRAIGLHAVDWEADLLHEAIVRMLDGRRKWPREVSLVTFLVETMRSIASDHWRRLENPVVRSESEVVADGEADGSVVGNAPDEAMQPERRAMAAETLAAIEALFGEDADALQVIDGMASGRSPREIQEETGMDATRYASTQRRIRRRVDRAMANGGELA